MVTGSSPMKQQFVALHIPHGSKKSTSVWRKWKRLTACQKRSFIVVIFLIITTFLVCDKLHDLHKKSKMMEKDIHKKKHQKKHKGLDSPDGDLVDTTDQDKIYDSYISESQIANDSNIHLQNDPNIGEHSKSEKPLDLNIYGWKGHGTESMEQKEIKKAFQHAWRGYKKYAWGHDMLKPISGGYEDWFTTDFDHMGLTLIDSLDVMVLMGLDDEFAEARKFVAEKMSLAPDRNTINLFECTIRVLGGFLSTYHLTNDELFKMKAIEIGERLLPAMKVSKTNVAYSDVNLKTGQVHSPSWGPSSSTSEVTTIQMEFSDLSFVTNDPKYEEYVYNISKHVSSLGDKLDGLVPLWINPDTGKFKKKAGSTITMGARTDSYYEYLFKRWYQEKVPKYEFLITDFKEAMEGAKKHLFGRTKPNQYLFIGEKHGQVFSPKMDHLVCYLPGTLALAYSANVLTKEWLDYAEELAIVCNQYYNTETGLAPEICYFNTQHDDLPDLDIHVHDRFSILRPETVESYFYLWRLTKNPKYREWGWTFFQNLEKYARVTNGYTSISDVTSGRKPGNRDKMESFFLGETLKYLYLLFSDDDFLPLDSWVFNTEAHPLPVMK